MSSTNFKSVLIIYILNLLAGTYLYYAMWVKKIIGGFIILEDLMLDVICNTIFRCGEQRV